MVKLAFLFSSSSLALDGDPIFLGTLVSHLKSCVTMLLMVTKQLVLILSSETVIPAWSDVSINPSICGSRLVRNSQWFAESTSNSG